jgi:hypothetical protein
MAASSEREQYYPFAFSALAYVQCNGELVYVRPCAAGLFWNQDDKICDHAETSPARPANDQVTYGYQQQQPTYTAPMYNAPTYNAPTYNAPTPTLADKSVDKSQGYRFRNYNPAMIASDQSSSYGTPSISYGSPSSSLKQVLIRQQSPILNAFYTPSSLMSNNRRIQTNSYSNQDQQSNLIDQSFTPKNIGFGQQQQYGQLNSDQNTNSYTQPQPQQQRILNRVFQPESPRSLNIKSTSSGYRRRR